MSFESKLILSQDFTDSRSFLIRCRLELTENTQPMTLHEGLVLLNTTHSLRILVPSRFSPHSTPPLQRWKEDGEERPKAGSLIEGLYGPTFGMPLTEEEGSSGFGKCIGVFTGGEVSHGHKAAVLNAVRVLQAA